MLTDTGRLYGSLSHSCEARYRAQGAAQAQPAPATEAWRQNFKPLDEGLQTAPKLQSIPDMAPADSANINPDAKTSVDAEVAASSAAEGPNSTMEGVGGAGANVGSQQLPPAKSGRLESKERISSMLHPIGKDSAMEDVKAEAQGNKKMGCFGGSSQAKESSKPCVIF